MSYIRNISNKASQHSTLYHHVLFWKIKGWRFTHMHDRIISLRGDVWAYETSLTPSLFIEVSVPSPVSEWSYICVLGVWILPLLYDFSILFWNCTYSVIFYFWTVPTVWYFYCHFITLFNDVLLTIAIKCRNRVAV